MSTEHAKPATAERGSQERRWHQAPTSRQLTPSLATQEQLIKCTSVQRSKHGPGRADPPRSRSHRHALAITLKLSLPSRHTTGSKQKCQGSVILTRKPRAGNRHPSGPEEVRGRSGGLGQHRAQWARGHSDHGHLDPAEGLVPANCKCCKASVSPPGKGEQRQQGCAKPSAARECRDHS